MASNEVTIAEMLRKADYTTGVFGKWHLGDNFPSRPNDQGFDESLIHLSGGMGQVGDFTTYYQGDRSYFDPVLWHNGEQEAYKGYCSDIFADQAIDFIEKNHENPFFCYLSFNAPHTPLQVPDKYYQMYKDIDPSTGFEKDKRPFVKMSEKDKEDARKVYAMVSNIDDNIGKLLQKLKDLKISKNTLVVFMTDNGPQQIRYVAGMRGRKGSVFRGGVRVPFFMRYPARWKGKREIETTTAHIDMLPTLADICGAPLPADREIDGKNLVPLLNKQTVAWEDRSLFFYWTRRYPELYQNMAFQKGPYKLVGHTDYNAPISDFNLFNIENDPYEQHNLVEVEKEKALTLKSEMDAQYKQLVQSPNLLDPPRIHVGNAAENPVVLNRNDAAGQRGIWSQEEVYGKWAVQVEPGRYDIEFKFIKPVAKGGILYMEAGTTVNRKKNDHDNVDIINMKNVELPRMKGDLIPFYALGNKKIFPFWVALKKIN